MDEVWATGRRHVKISKLYLKALLRRGPNIFVALAWSQVSPLFVAGAFAFFAAAMNEYLICLT